MGTAFDILSAGYRPMVLAYLQALVADRHLAEDLTQETMLAAQRSLASFDPERNFGAWLRGIARHQALQDRRAKARRPLLIDSAVVEGIEQVYVLFDEAPGPWAERIARVRDCVARLNDNLRAAVIAVYQRGQSLREAAASLGVKFDAMAQRLSRGRRLIRQCVELGITEENPKETEHV
jgi:RNA polymerase sigma-70 factor (ECF subfamily)